MGCKNFNSYTLRFFLESLYLWRGYKAEKLMEISINAGMARLFDCEESRVREVLGGLSVEVNWWIY